MRPPGSSPRSPAPGGPGRRLVVARHGRTAWNATGRYQGHADVPLDAEGDEQAAHLADRLAKLEPARVVASDLCRARDTARPLAERAGQAVVTDPRLREVDVGAWEGMTAQEAAERFPAEWAAWQAGDDVARGGGETRGSAGRRAAAAILDHAGRVPPGAVLVVVSHGMVLRSALQALAADGLVDLGADPPHLGNGAWMEVHLAGGM